MAVTRPQRTRIVTAPARPASQPNEQGITKNRIIAELTRSAHGDLNAYLPVGSEAAAQDKDFFAHLIAWDRRKGQIRDTKVALPVISLAKWGPFADRELLDNSLAHLVLLDPRSFVRALTFAREVGVVGLNRQLQRLVERYLREREKSWGWWERTALQHRASMKTLYARFHVKPSGTADLILFKGTPPKGTMFDDVRNLSKMSPREAAAIIVHRKIPFLVALGALGANKKDPDLLLALLDSMSPTELVTNMKMLEKLGVNDSPALRAKLAEKLQKAATSTKATLKTTRAVDAGGIKNEKLKQTMREVQEKQIDAAGQVEGNWLVLGDKSGSMAQAIEGARQVAGLLSRAVTGEVLLVFFDTQPRAFDVTGKSYDEIRDLTRNINAAGGTSIGVGLNYALETGFEMDGIALISDGAEHQGPFFATTHALAEQKLGKQIPVYFYKTAGEPDSISGVCGAAGIEMQTFDLRGGFDFYSLPNLIATMRANRYSLIDEILGTPLLTVDGVFADGG